MARVPYPLTLARSQGSWERLEKNQGPPDEGPFRRAAGSAQRYVSQLDELGKGGGREVATGVGEIVEVVPPEE
jgi:hypothetical protein